MEDKNNIRQILVVEDDTDVRETIQLVLQPMHYGLTFAENGREALRLVDEKRSYCLILSDITMPEMDGLRFFEEVRARGLSTPFVFLTAYGDRKYLFRALKLGAFDYIEKPFSAKHLEDVIHMAVEVGAGLLDDSRLREEIARQGGTWEGVSKALAKNEQFRNLLRVKNERFVE